MASRSQKTGSQKPRRSGAGRAAATILTLALAGGASVYAATAAVGFLEERLGSDARAALANGGFDWAKVKVDGLQVRLSGEAPDEVQRFRAMVLAEGAVEAGRVIDEMDVAAVKAIATPDFEVEILRNDGGVSIIGLVPAGLDRDQLAKDLRDEIGSAKVTDLLETADYPVPESWDAAFQLGLRAAGLAPRAKISVGAGRVSVTAMTDSGEAKSRLETALRRAKPQNVTLEMDISAPRPVISPFTLRFVRDEDGTRFDACAADDEETRDQILAAAKAAGLEGSANCQLGLGAPSADWGKAAEAAIGAVGTLEGGQVTLSGTDLSLQAPPGTEQARLDEVVARLQTALPRLYSVTASIAKSEGETGPADFSAVMADAGNLVLRGRITDQRMREAVESYARSRFGKVDSALRLDPDVPSGWTVRVIAALEAMAGLQNGTAHVSPDLIRITGRSGNQTASDQAATSLAERLGAGADYELAIRYERRLDPELGLPSGSECVDRLNMVMRSSLIGFEPNKSVIAGDPSPTLTELGTAMKDCEAFRIEIGGHTDSQGSDAFNADLSRKRAQAVLEAMTKAGIPTQEITARGYGESMPIADNETEAGREANRRIEFKLLAEEPIREDEPATPATVKGVTSEPVQGEMQGPQLPETPVATAETETPAAEAPAEAAPGAAAPGELVVSDELRDYAEMAASLLVTELAGMGGLNAEGGPFDTFGEGEGEGMAEGADEAQTPTPAAAAPAATAPAPEAATPAAPEAAAAVPAGTSPAPSATPSAQAATQPDPTAEPSAPVTPAPDAATPAATPAPAEVPSATPAPPTTTPTTTPAPAASASTAGVTVAASTGSNAAPGPDAALLAALVASAVGGVTWADQPGLTGLAASLTRSAQTPMAPTPEEALPPGAIAATTGAATLWQNPTIAASTAGLAVIQEAVSVPVLTPDETTPRPQPRPLP